MATLAKQRSALVTLMAATVASQQARHNWRYRPVRPQEVTLTLNDLVSELVDADCSDGVRCLCHAVGVKDDPAGTGYQPYGNSSSIWAHLHHISLTAAQPCDIVTFGRYSGESHALMLWEKYGTGDAEWWCWNHGATGQPAKRRLLDEIAAHAGMAVTVCRLNVQDPKPTPEDELRAMTGFYSWLAWQLGEGPWKRYGPENRAVRPNVPKVIPNPSWWARRAQFLSNRKKANPETKVKK